MAKIVINEISQNYTYNIGNTSYCEVAMPITSSWGPGYFNPDMYPNMSEEDIMESVAFQRFPATQAGLEAFVSTYRGPASNHRLAKDYSYQAAMTLLSAGYDILACRIAPGQVATAKAVQFKRLPSGYEIKIPAAAQPTGDSDPTIAFWNAVFSAGRSTESHIDIPLKTANIPNPASSGASWFEIPIKCGEVSEPVSFVQSGFKVELSSGTVRYDTGTITTSSELTIKITQVDVIPGVGALVSLDSVFYYSAIGTPCPNAVIKQLGYSTWATEPDADPDDHLLQITAKYPGTFGNSLLVKLSPIARDGINRYWNLIVYTVDVSGVRTAVENLSFVFNEENATDAIPYVDEIESDFIKLTAIGLDDDGGVDENGQADPDKNYLLGLAVGSDPLYIYTPIPYGQPAPEFEYGKYFKVSGYGDNYQVYYQVLTEKPDDWEASPWLYYNGQPVAPADTFNHDVLAGGTDVYVNNNCTALAEGDATPELGYLTAFTAKYTPVPRSTDTPETPPTWEANTYYIPDDTTMSLSTTEPDDWATTYYNYYTKEVLTPTSAETAAAGHSIAELYVEDAVSKALERYGAAYPNDSEADLKTTQYISALQDLIVHDPGDPGILPFDANYYQPEGSTDYFAQLPSVTYTTVPSVDLTSAKVLAHREWIFNAAYKVYDLLTDKLAYNPKRIISPGWDDQDILYITGELALNGLTRLSPFHIKLMNIAYYSRCATAYLDIPRSLPRAQIYDESSRTGKYAQLLGRYEPMNTGFDVNGQLYHTHAALFVPWGQYKYVGTSKYNIASPSFQALMIERSMILNQSAQYEWALPVNRHHKVRLGKLDFAVSKKYLDVWQKLEGVGVNVITNIPDRGISLWGNSTLYEVPPATYQALANLSTRKLVNAVEDIVYRCGIAITFQYNNDQAYSSFYAGVTPLLDTMKNIGAIDDYYVKMAADINGEDHVNANTVIGKIYLVINGVINDIIVDLVALPPSTDLSQFKG